jgi:hypothetical protein
LEEKTSAFIQEVAEHDVPGLSRLRLEWVDLTLDLLVKVNRPDSSPAEPSGKLGILTDVAFSISAITNAIGSTMVENAKKLERMIGLAPRDHADLFPWLPGPGRIVMFHAPLALKSPLPGFDLEKPLAGQHSSEMKNLVSIVKIVPIGVPESAGDGLRLGIPIAVIVIESISFEEGSLYGWIRGHVQVLALAATLISSPAVYNIAQAEWNIYETHVAIGSALKDQPAVKYRAFRFSEDELKSHGERAFNYEESGISPDARRDRMALTQLALKMALGTQIVIDGNVGPETLAHMKRLGELRNLPGNIKNPFFRAELLKALQPHK